MNESENSNIRIRKNANSEIRDDEINKQNGCNHDSKEDLKIRFSIIDISRILIGLVVLNIIVSYLITSSLTWGYKGKYLDISYYKFLMSYPCVKHTLTIEELSKYNGSNVNLPIYLSLNGTIYDVSANRGLYAIGGSYNLLTGKDATRAFVTGCLNKRDEYTYDLRNLDPQVVEKSIKNWVKYFDKSSRYWKFGKVIYEEVKGDPPTDCLTPMKYPFH
ncbi:hypothetical protein BVG19_g1429 [[Candida] boidinii]|nr:hypothetical protein BVG19_g1429 [[Candida] boidinii]OWB50856.1 hypothetical protein B5S27_g2409 [[Candida] boidinii]